MENWTEVDLKFPGEREEDKRKDWRTGLKIPSFQKREDDGREDLRTGLKKSSSFQAREEGRREDWGTGLKKTRFPEKKRKAEEKIGAVD